MMGAYGPTNGAFRIDLSETGDFDLGGLQVRPAHREVEMNGDRRELEPRVAQVLVALALARPAVVSRDRLIEQCWDGRIVGDDAISRCILALRHLAKDYSPEPFAIETVPRVGYCLVERPSENAAMLGGRRNFYVRIGLAAVLGLVLVAGGLFAGWSRMHRASVAPASIAVLSFRNLSAGDPYFAEGIGEEILGQLSREPQFRVAGRASSSEFGNDPDVRDVARRLDVDYVVEGSVRRQGDRVRVDANLVRASDGIRMWSDSYDGTLDDIFAIQQRIGGAIAGALQRKLIRAPTLSGPLVTNGEAYNLYLTARGLIRTRDRNVFVTSSNLLRDAIKLDPNYAPAWSSLAESTSLEDAPDGAEGSIAATPRAIGYAQHALQLAPDLADAHRVLASLMPYGSPEALAHERRAVALEPNNAEALLDLGSALGAAGDFDAEMAAYTRAGDIDPLWFRTTGQKAMALAERGRRSDAEAVGQQGFANNAPNLHILLGRIAWIFGDYSEAARHWSIAAGANSPRWSARGKSGVADSKAAVGLLPGRANRKLSNPFARERFEVSADAPPPAATWQMRNRNAIAADVYRDANQVAAKLMLGAGRARELVATYDSAVGLLSLHRNGTLRADQLHEAAVVALAFRQVGRSADADGLLEQANSTIASVYRRGQVPFAFDADAASIWAVEGRSDQALAMLERAVRRGWTHAGTTDLIDIVDEPAFKSLRGQPRFERLRATFAAHIARERAEMMRLRI